MHLGPNKKNGYRHTFTCDDCRLEAGSGTEEHVALDQARATVEREHWQWQHPGWGLKCPACLKGEGQ